MGETVIRVEGLSKRYLIGAAQAASGTLRGQLTRLARGAFRRRRAGDPEPEHIWALNDVSFEINRGDVVGIIGHNGSGKSTLLKILSRITRPTRGRAEVYGRMASLLEVGTGFHPELTGRENIFLNGVTLGMKKAEIARKFDEIVDFAGVERFIDTPVKRYSSGMYVRLAFAVAAHLEPELLVVDEVLSVGDVAFQKKSLRRMEAVAGSGRTVLFVSHSMPSVMGLCQRVIWLRAGLKEADGPSADVVRRYLNASVEGSDEHVPLAARTDRSGDGSLRITNFRMQDAEGRPVPAAITGSTVEFVLGYVSYTETVRSAGFWISVRDGLGRLLTTFWSSLTGDSFDDLPREGEVVCRIEKLPLVPGDYHLDLGAAVNFRDKADEIPSAVRMEVLAGDFYGTGREYNQVGDFLCEQSWRRGVAKAEEKESSSLC